VKIPSVGYHVFATTFELMSCWTRVLHNAGPFAALWCYRGRPACSSSPSSVHVARSPNRTCTLSAACNVATVLPPPPGHRWVSIGSDTIVELTSTYMRVKHWKSGIATGVVPTRCSTVACSTCCKHAAARSVKRCSHPCGVDDQTTGCSSLSQLFERRLGIG
jgi:hypothetical protein